MFPTPEVREVFGFFTGMCREIRRDGSFTRSVDVKTFIPLVHETPLGQTMILLLAPFIFKQKQYGLNEGSWKCSAVQGRSWPCPYHYIITAYMVVLCTFDLRYVATFRQEKIVFLQFRKDHAAGYRKDHAALTIQKNDFAASSSPIVQKGYINDHQKQIPKHICKPLFEVTLISLFLVQQPHLQVTVTLEFLDLHRMLGKKFPKLFSQMVV